MKFYTDSEAKKNLELLLGEAGREGAVGIRREDGSTFIVRPESSFASPFGVNGVNLPISTAEIIEFIHEGRREG
jgi:hypothetical protein